MMINKEFYSVSELAATWKCAVSDLLHFGIQNRAQICVNIYGMASSSCRTALESGKGELEIEPEPENDDEYREAAEMNAAHEGWLSRTTRDMPHGIFELGIESLRFVEMPGGFPHDLHEAMKFDGRWWSVEFDPPVTINLDHLCILNEEVLRLDKEEFCVDSANLGLPEKPLATTERNTLLTIIAAICDYSKIKHQERGAAGQIAKLTEKIGAVVTDDTIRKALAKIPDAIETRMK